MGMKLTTLLNIVRPGVEHTVTGKIKSIESEELTKYFNEESAKALVTVGGLETPIPLEDFNRIYSDLEEISKNPILGEEEVDQEIHNELSRQIHISYNYDSGRIDYHVETIARYDGGEGFDESRLEEKELPSERYVGRKDLKLEKIDKQKV